MSVTPIFAAAWAIVSLATPAAVPTPQVMQGLRVAQAHCGECHAVSGGISPLADAPSFAGLYRRYRSGGLEQLLREGMLAPDPPPEEGTSPMHPRMPSVVLDVEERAALVAYLHSLEPPAAVLQASPDHPTLHP